MSRPSRLVRNPAVADVEVEGDIFLVEPRTQDVVRLNKIASALWRYLARPRERDDIVAVFAAAFPQVRRARLARDLAKGIADLRRRGLIVPVS
jgi:hypothetical protein